MGLVALGASSICAQDYPNRPIRIMTGAAGGGNDFASRLIAQGISGVLGQPVVVENRPSILLGDLVSKAPPDGYTVLLAGGTFVIGPFLEKMSYDSIRDFSPITLIELSASVVVLHPSVPVKSIKELIAFAKSRPGQLNYASAGVGSPIMLAAELFKSMAGVDIVGVPYKGSGPALNDLLGGQVQLMFASPTSVMPHVKSGRLRALAVTSPTPSALIPGLPTVASSLSGYQSAGITAMFAPAKTPEAIIKRLNQEVVRLINQPDVKQKFFEAGVEIIGSSPEQLAATVKSEVATMSKLIKDIGIKVN